MSAPATSWDIRGGTIVLDRPRVMGVLNVTPDSFSDGGHFAGVDAAVAHGETMAEEGADLIDVGGESTRPQGAEVVPVTEELDRVVPVIAALARRLPGIAISVDTSKSEVARAAIDAGAAVVNDVSAFRLDPRMGEICAEAGVGVVLMHSRGGVREMATFVHARYDERFPMREVMAELLDAVATARGAGVDASRIALDPGIGFAKRSEHSLAVLRELASLAAQGFPVVVGVSRKRFIGELTNRSVAAERVFGTVGANVAALERGARIFRVHDVRANREALDVAWAILADPSQRRGAEGDRT